jgi:AraC-like DNA-binding protein
MNLSFIILIVSLSCLGIEVLFAFSFLGWMKSNRSEKEKNLQFLNKERKELRELQGSIHSEFQQYSEAQKAESQKLLQIGAQVESQWLEIQAKMLEIQSHLDQKSSQLLQEIQNQTGQCSNQFSLAHRKAQLLLDKVDEKNKQIQEVMDTLSLDLSQDDILEMLKTQKYEKAKIELRNGAQASDIAKRLGLSMSEVALISSMQI